MKPFPERDGDLRVLAEKRLSSTAIAREMNISCYFVIKRCGQLGIELPEKSEVMSAARKQAWADPAVRAKMSAASKQALADPAVRAKMSAARKQALADPAVRAKMSAARKQALADPNKGQKHLRGLTTVQRADYRLFRRKGFSKQEALALLRPLKAAE